VAMLGKVKDKFKSSDEAYVMCVVSAGFIYLRKRDVAAAKAAIEEAGKLVDELPAVTRVHSLFYELSSLYYKLIGDFAQYYRHSLRYLGCTDLAKIAIEAQQERAFDLCLAALLGKDVYNFGELLQHHILESLRSTPDKGWLPDLVGAFNAGNMAEFISSAATWRTQPDLVSHENDLMLKMRLMAIVELAFSRPGQARHIPFADIAARASLDVNAVELLLIKAMSLGLIRGIIDEVAQVVHVSWVQPRVLDKNQLTTMQQRIMTWCRDVSNVEQLIEMSPAKEVIVAAEY